MQDSENPLEVITNSAVGYPVVVHDLDATELVIGGIDFPPQHLEKQAREETLVLAEIKAKLFLWFSLKWLLSSTRQRLQFLGLVFSKGLSGPSSKDKQTKTKLRKQQQERERLLNNHIYSCNLKTSKPLLPSLWAFTDTHSTFQLWAETRAVGEAGTPGQRPPHDRQAWRSYCMDTKEVMCLSSTIFSDKSQLKTCCQVWVLLFLSFFFKDYFSPHIWFLKVVPTHKP